MFVVNTAVHKTFKMKTAMTILFEIVAFKDTVKTIILIAKTYTLATMDVEVTIEIIHRPILDPNFEIDILIDLEVPTNLVLDITIIIKEEINLDPHKDHHIKTIQTIETKLHLVIDLLRNPKENPLDDKFILTDLHLDQEIIDLDQEHLHKLQ